MGDGPQELQLGLCRRSDCRPCCRVAVTQPLSLLRRWVTDSGTAAQGAAPEVPNYRLRYAGSLVSTYGEDDF